ncbi:glycoside hydrolase family 55 protein [Atractiella rhizophila]|nr:glycoside hydrolase family 55 protein [Atractiella rhizophila]
MLSFLLAALSLVPLLASSSPVTSFTNLTDFGNIQRVGSSCNGQTLSPTNPATYWYQDITKNGVAPFAGSGYAVYRNVKDFGAKGDGVTDDTAAINNAISSGGRCGANCPSTTKTPAVVYFPPGTYLVSSPVIQYYITQFLSDPRNPATIKATANFNFNGLGLAIIETDPYIPGGGGAQWYTNQNQFYRGIRNMRIDMTAVPNSVGNARALHWQVSQATHLQNIEIVMTQGATSHTGLWMENGSGGFFSDITVRGGGRAIDIGNQQFTIRNLKVYNADIAVYAVWNWGFTWIGTVIENCRIGWYVQTGSTQAAQTVQGEYFLDTTATNVVVLVQTSTDITGNSAGSIILDNAKVSNVQFAVQAVNGVTSLQGPGTGTIDLWVRGPGFTTNGGAEGSYTTGGRSLSHWTKPASLLTSSGAVFGRSRPQYEQYSASQFYNVKSAGATGNGNTDDTAAIQNAINQNWGCKIIYFPYGIYRVSNTITVPTGTIIVGEAWPQIQAFGSNFANAASPRVVFKVGNTGDVGSVEISGMVFNTVGGSAGAIMLEWNVAQSSQGATAIWDSHIRIGGTQGTNLQTAQCSTSSTNTACFGAFLGLHIRAGASGYFEGLWNWVADHDLEVASQGQMNVLAPRGLLDESTGPVWLMGTGSEHWGLYQYNFKGAQNVFAGLIQTESAYYQPTPAPSFYPANSAYGDPTSYPGDYGWATLIQNSAHIWIAGAGQYNFFQHYTQSCLDTSSCQPDVISVDSASSDVRIYQLQTVGSSNMVKYNGQSLIGATNYRTGFTSSITYWKK